MLSTSKIRRSSSIELLASLLLLMLAAAFFDIQSVYGAAISLIFALVLVTAVRVVTDTLRHRIAAYTLAVFWLVFSLFGVLTRSGTIQFFTDLSFIIFCFFCVVIILRRVILSKTVDFEIIFASVAAYFLLAIAWAVSYDLIYILDSQSFSFAREEIELTLNHFIYFSLTTITTLGYGDITPTSVPVGIWATLEAATGVFYMAILVARLVSAYRG